MNDNNTQYYVGSTINQEKNVPTMKQTEEKTTNNKISMPSVCFFCRRKCRDYSYLVETVYELDWNTFEFTDKIKDVVSKGIICYRCRDYNVSAHTIILREDIEMVDQGE